MHAQFHLCMPTVPKSEAEILNILKLLLDVQGNGRLATDSQVCKWTSDGDPEQGHFTKCGLPREIPPAV